MIYISVCFGSFLIEFLCFERSSIPNLPSILRSVMYTCNVLLSFVEPHICHNIKTGFSMETKSWIIITKMNSLISHLYLLNLGKSFGCTQELSLPQHSLHSVRHAISVLLYKHPIFYRCVICPRVWEPYCVQFTSFCVKLALIIVYIWIYRVE